MQKVLIRVKLFWLKLTGKLQSERRSARQRDELAEPLLHEEEEERQHDRLEDIQEVDLEAGQGSSHTSSSRPNAQDESAAERYIHPSLTPRHSPSHLLTFPSPKPPPAPQTPPALQGAMTQVEGSFGWLAHALCMCTHKYVCMAVVRDFGLSQ